MPNCVPSDFVVIGFSGLRPTVAVAKTYTIQRHDGNTARLARRSDEALGVRVSVARIAPSLLDLGRATTSPPTKANRVRFPAGSLAGFRLWESCRTMPLIGGFSRVSPVSPAIAFRRCSILNLFHPHRLSKPLTLLSYCEEPFISIVLRCGQALVSVKRFHSLTVSDICVRGLAPYLGEQGSFPVRVRFPDFCTRESCRTMPLVGRVFSRISPPPPRLCTPGLHRIPSLHVHRCSKIPFVQSRPRPPQSNTTSADENQYIGNSPPCTHIHYLPKSNWAPVHNVCSVVVTLSESRRATSCGYTSSHPVWHALYECLQDIHGDSSPFLLQPFHELSNGFWPRLTSPHPAIQFVLKMLYRVEVGALGGPVQLAIIVIGVPLHGSP
ncbi:hypothetical protein PR048_032178 [Dryococelus australis]|uniref:Uncharacterized protein n=1 Tax=Dryococelus australis TaxID=614101 RepID=A0ABQ9G1H7_9NEOP|nr:hypothetical protein PR048_032178 [Dryococelus australis]